MVSPILKIFVEFMSARLQQHFRSFTTPFGKGRRGCELAPTRLLLIWKSQEVMITTLCRGQVMGAARVTAVNMQLSTTIGAHCVSEFSYFKEYACPLNRAIVVPLAVCYLSGELRESF